MVNYFWHRVSSVTNCNKQNVSNLKGLNPEDVYLFHRKVIHLKEVFLAILEVSFVRHHFPSGSPRLTLQKESQLVDCNRVNMPSDPQEALPLEDGEHCHQRMSKVKKRMRYQVTTSSSSFVF